MRSWKLESILKWEKSTYCLLFKNGCWNSPNLAYKTHTDKYVQNFRKKDPVTGLTSWCAPNIVFIIACKATKWIDTFCSHFSLIFPDWQPTKTNYTSLLIHIPEFALGDGKKVDCKDFSKDYSHRNTGQPDWMHWMHFLRQVVGLEYFS